MTAEARKAIAWLRRDLRLADNRTLEAATRLAAGVWPVFVADPHLLERHRTAPARVAWFGANLTALDEELRAAGSGLTVLEGDPAVVLRRFAAEVGADAVFAAADEDPVAVSRDGDVAAAVTLHLVDDIRIVPPASVRTGSGDPYTVFSPFRRALDARVPDAGAPDVQAAEAATDRLQPRPAGAVGAEAFPAPDAPHSLPPAGEHAATERLRSFLRDRIARYEEDRDHPGIPGTSGLSPYLRVGAVSVRAAWRAALNAGERGRERGDRRLVAAAEKWRGELAWREFFAHVLAAHPRLATQSYRPELDGVEWATGTEADDAVSAWREGRTGFPLVDAGMRQLVATGWMHNRARLITASFLVKDAGVDWRRGESVFLEHLLDADTQQNNGNWQWVAGVGTDAVPYFRVFNPTLQARRYDPAGAYIRRWIPELADVPDAHIHEPWRAPEPPRGYSRPILDHATARRRTLARYAAITGRDD